MANPVRDDGKVVVQFRHTGNAPILRQQKFKVPADARFSTVTSLLRSHLRLTSDDPLVRTHVLTRARCCRLNTCACAVHSFCTAIVRLHHHLMSVLQTWLLAFTWMVC